MRKFNVKYRNKAEEIHYRVRDWGWVFSRDLLQNVKRRTGMAERELDHLFDVIGEEMFRILAEGHGCGLPYCPVPYFNYQRRKWKNPRTGQWLTLSVPTTKCLTPSPLREAANEVGRHRGALRDQYERKRLEITHTPRSRGKYAKRPDVPVYDEEHQLFKEIGS